MTSTKTFQGIHGNYVINSLQPFAYGRISVLYEGLDQNEHRVCIKIFRYSPKTSNDKSLINEFLREVTAQKTLEHPHILPILDFGKDNSEDSPPFLILPLCRGDLRDFMRSRSFIPLEDALPILQQVALAIDFAHKSGFIHGDIKPENILFLKDNCYLSDFGMSKYFSIKESFSSTAEPIIGGSTLYLSPEQLNEGKQFPSSDIYSFGVVTYEMLTGFVPFNIYVPPFRQMKQKIEGELIDPHDVNQAISDKARCALLKTLEADYRRRPSSASEFCQMLISGVPNETYPYKSARAEMKDKVILEQDTGKIKEKQKKSKRFWDSLEPATKVAIITAIIAAITGIIVAIIQVIPTLRK